ncbi:hypothetical protein SAMN05216419_102426 [Nitrosomonas cryotolerans]|uniref:Uncharacterized protein n=1 Tax=Nitrosomonas cryotolerans ATCC 49181 TaxID=1131553 RepID=A0A1N6ITW2_9PROT|nr:hypothetical protein SAMN05216419_102426 [Nitrosomonas cryotolerans]SIO35446.1 hypothetical protein SAMN02743940_2071 [Nitrosomonas cryotolerans ATCC 49181]
MKRYIFLLQSKQFFFFVIFAFLIFVFISRLGYASQEADTLRDHVRDLEDVVVRYTEIPNIAGEGASLHIYNDGYAVVSYPAYMQRAGNYGIYLNQETLDHLWVLVTGKDILEFNEQAVFQRKSALNQARKELLSKLSNITDTFGMRLEIYPNRYKFVGFRNGDSGELKEIFWSGLKWDAYQFPEIKEIQILANIQQALMAVMARSDLKKID